jgi:bacillolysin
MSMDENLILYRSESDNLGFVHNRYQQYYKNIKVEMGEYLTHEKERKLISANGIWLDRVNIKCNTKD